MDSRQLQSKRNDIKNNNDIELLSTHMRKIQNTAEIGIIASTKAVVDRKRFNNRIKKVSCIIG